MVRTERRFSSVRRVLRRPRESDAVERPVVEHARRRGWIALKLESRVYTGFPDRAFFLPGGVVVLIEFKRPGGARSALQVERGAHLAVLGHFVYVFDDALDAIDHLEAVALGVPRGATRLEA